jgi:hypothetical protein
MQSAQFDGCFPARAIAYSPLHKLSVQRISQPQGFGLFHSFSAHVVLKLKGLCQQIPVLSLVLYPPSEYDIKY